MGWLRPVSILTILAAQIALIPIVAPVLPVEKLGAYLNSLPFEIPRTEVSHRGVALPQHYADQFGWRELAALAAQGWQQIPEEERADCAIFGQNYGEAGAIDWYGPHYGLPPAISGHQTYYLWGPRSYSGKCMLVIGDRKERLEELFEEVKFVGVTDAPYALQSRIPLFICRRLKQGTLQTLWSQLKLWR
jgi:hypothetical protein